MTDCGTDLDTLVEFTANQPKRGSPATPGFVTEEEAARLKRVGKISGLRRFTRKFINDKVVMPDGKEIEFWGFEDENGRRGLPSPPIRAREREIVQVTLKPSKRTHTIHHHGIEPDDFNDGVGHTSFEVTGEYTYQWFASHCGSYFYHCHVNTVLHVQMGMFGTLIIDPEDGGKRVFSDAFPYDVEFPLTTFEIDPQWHELGHAAGLDGEDVGLHNFNPRYFSVNGVFAKDSHDPSGIRMVTDPRATLRATVGERILLRILNGSYFPVRVRLPKELDGVVVAHDARPFSRVNRRTGEPIKNDPQVLRLGNRQFDRLSTAEREDLVVRASKPGTYRGTVFFEHWITGDLKGRVDFPIIIEPK